MSKGRIVALVLGAVLLAAAAALLLRPAEQSGGAAAQVAPLVGHPAPPFALADVTGKQRDLAQLRGHVVLLNFWATWCIPCRSEMPAIDRVYRRNHGRLVVLAIDKQEPAGDVTSFGRRHGLTFPLLLDPSLTVWNQYKVTIQPVSFWIDKNGTVRAIHYGPMDPKTIGRQLARLAA